MAKADGDSSERVIQSREQVSKLRPPRGLQTPDPALSSSMASDNEDVKSALSNQETTLTSIFSMTVILLNRLIRKMSGLPEINLPEETQDGKEPVYKKPKDIRATLEDYALDLRIWSKDLTTHGNFALDILDVKGEDEERVATIKLGLHDKLIAIRRILIPLAMRFDIPTLGEMVLDDTDDESEQLNPVDPADLKYDVADYLELREACLQLKPCIVGLRAAKLAIKEAAESSLAKRLPTAEQNRSGSKQKMIPNALCLGALN